MVLCVAQAGIADDSPLFEPVSLWVGHCASVQNTQKQLEDFRLWLGEANDEV